jgi:hypothetical protein
MAPCGIPVGTVDRKRWTSEMTASVKGQEDKSLTPRLLSSACHIHKRARKDYIECTTCRGDAKNQIDAEDTEHLCDSDFLIKTSLNYSITNILQTNAMLSGINFSGLY